ncbi:Crp/Fnr family transcriptional regulator [Rhodoferax lacus]|uniref:Crp/Fnr family transcriptional regulator n=1 Tax=Rhodoferax lacus TaxID=2184758 RepID=UPI001314ACCD|nr:helix-turn-helix domain-containing protein [Rhodoferax lacus]
MQVQTNNTAGLAPGASVFSPALQPVRYQRHVCESSSLSEVMALLRFDGAPSAAAHNHVFRHQRVRSGQSVFAMGQSFNGLYVVRSGALKSVVMHDDGNDNVISFHMKGDLLGSDGVYKKHYGSEAVALTDCEVIRLPGEDFFSPSRRCDDMEHMLYWAISREITREQMSYTVSHAPRSEVRVARFLLQQSESFAAMGCSPRRFSLTMTRRDIGNYLSVTLETVSRALSLLNHLGIIEISNRDVTLIDTEALRMYEG